MTDPLLGVDGLTAGYGDGGHAIDSLSLAVAGGEAMALVGRNGAGKSTLMKTIAGLLTPTAGRIRYRDTEIGGLAPAPIARLGIAYVPEDRRMFTDLTVRENIAVARRGGAAGRWSDAALFALFPNLAEIADRSAGATSGGEQQMIAIARALAGEPRFLMLDEPCEGLAPKIVGNLIAAIATLRAEGLTLLISEQNPKLVARLADRAAVVASGRIVWTGPVADLDSGGAVAL